MSETKWTKEQQRVIDLRDCNILVSAAAGSGKTAVLVERIISRIMDRENPVDIDQFVIVTFTKAAAAEMREKIGKALDKAVEKYPDNNRLVRQIPLLRHAQISTINSFCGFVIQNYFHRIGIDPSYRMGNETEMSMIKSDVLEEMLEEKYQNATKDFIELADCYMFDKDDSKLEDLILTIYDYAISNPWPTEWFASRKNLLSLETVEEWQASEFYQEMNDYINQILHHCLETAEEMMEICHLANGPYMYEKAITSDLELLEELCEQEDFEERTGILTNFTFAKLSPARSDSVDVGLREQVKNMRDMVKKEVKELTENFFYQSLGEHISDIRLMAGKLITLLELAEEFGKRFEVEKREKGLADFSDLEHLAISILLTKDEKTGEVVPTEAADELAGQFEEIMIDEYQDSNLVQDTILRSVSRERFGRQNIFMVGDVKQSIYRFRLARPELFIEKLNNYDKEKGSYRRVDLHKNFRSRSLVLDCVNAVFRRIMKPDLGEIDYTDEAALYPGLEFPEVSDELKEKAGRICERIEVIGIDDKDSGNELEAKAIAGKIKEMVNPRDPLYVREGDGYRPATYHDIVILVRSAKSFAEPLERVLQAEGIPTNSEKKEGFYQTEEIRIMVDMFRVLDNPRQDIPLTAVLRGPIFSFEDEELARLRSVDKKADFYENLCCYAKDGNDDNLKKKVLYFLQIIDEIRESLTYATVSDVIRQIYEKTGIYEKILLMPEARRKVANLELLMREATAFDSTVYHGLFQFVRYLKRISVGNTDVGEANISGENENVVRIVTIHKSKGLEYPICILAGMGRKLEGRDGWLFMHPQLGIASESVDNERRLRKNNIMRQYIRVANKLEDLGEEFRILYVAITRAKEKLIFTGAMPKWSENYVRWESSSGSFLERKNMSCFFDMVMPVLIQEDKKEWHIEEKTREMLLQDEVREEIGKKVSDAMFYNFDTNQIYDEETEKLLTFVEDYEYQGAGEDIPVKVSVSDLKKKSLEEDEMPSFKVLSPDIMEEEAPVPAFIRKRGEEVLEKGENRGARYGTIYHQAMAVMDFTKINSVTDVKQQMTELLQSGKMVGNEISVLNEEKLFSFFSSNLGQRMKQALEEKRLYREQPFVLGVKAREILPDKDSDEMVLVQGIIDGFFEENGELVLMDYKTDALPSGGDNILIKRYHVQMEFYRRALESITGKKVKETILYSFSLGKEIPLDRED